MSRYYIITDGFVNTQKNKLVAVNVYEIFDEIIITDELGMEYRKPHPKAFEIMPERLKVGFNKMFDVGAIQKKDFYVLEIYLIKTIIIIRNDSIYKA